VPNSWADKKQLSLIFFSFSPLAYSASCKALGRNSITQAQSNKRQLKEGKLTKHCPEYIYIYIYIPM
jgi:hypothetical protein